VTFDLNIWRAGFSWHYLSHSRMSRSKVKVRGHRRNIDLKWSVRPRVRAFRLGFVFIAKSVPACMYLSLTCLASLVAVVYLNLSCFCSFTVRYHFRKISSLWFSGNSGIYNNYCTDCVLC